MPDLIAALPPSSKPAHTLAAGGAGDPIAAHLLKRCYLRVASEPWWRLRTGQLVSLSEGCFLQPTKQEGEEEGEEEGEAGQEPARPVPPQLLAGGAGGVPQAPSSSSSPPVLPSEPGAAALGFIEREVPLFDVPWSVKQSLEAAGVQGLRVVGPAVMREIVRRLVRTRAQQQQNAAGGLDQHGGMSRGGAR
jgi:sacsin